MQRADVGNPEPLRDGTVGLRRRLEASDRVDAELALEQGRDAGPLERVHAGSGAEFVSVTSRNPASFRRARAGGTSP